MKDTFMSLSMYDLSVPRFKHIMTTLQGILKKAEEYSADKKLDLDVLPSCRLIADMYPLARQIQIMSDQSKGCVARLAGETPPSFADKEKTLPELIERLERTIQFIESIPAERVNGSEAKEITLELPSMTLKFSGQKYLLEFVYPNIYFHFSTAYNILRKNGVPLSKLDFIGNIF